MPHTILRPHHPVNGYAHHYTQNGHVKNNGHGGMNGTGRPWMNGHATKPEDKQSTLSR
ncbi:Calpain-B-like Protein [Tribolium castaneum]|nr:Calpain-B-like Protein [Tribolium castaneum]